MILKENSNQTLTDSTEVTNSNSNEMKEFSFAEHSKRASAPNIREPVSKTKAYEEFVTPVND